MLSEKDSFDSRADLSTMRHQGVRWQASGFVSVHSEGLMINELGLFNFGILFCIAIIIGLIHLLFLEVNLNTSLRPSDSETRSIIRT